MVFNEMEICASKIRCIIVFSVVVWFVLGERSSPQLIVKHDCCSVEVRDRAKSHVPFSPLSASGFRFV